MLRHIKNSFLIPMYHSGINQWFIILKYGNIILKKILRYTTEKKERLCSEGDHNNEKAGHPRWNGDKWVGDLRDFCYAGPPLDCDAPDSDWQEMNYYHFINQQILQRITTLMTTTPHSFRARTLLWEVTCLNLFLRMDPYIYLPYKKISKFLNDPFFNPLFHLKPRPRKIKKYKKNM